VDGRIARFEILVDNFFPECEDDICMSNQPSALSQ